jgi:hypothetical protein
MKIIDQITKSAVDILTICSEAVGNSIILEPKLPAAILAEQVAAGMEPDVLVELGRQLAVAHLARMIRTARGKESRKEKQQLSLPGFEHLPFTIRLADNNRVSIRDATYSQVRAYYRRLSVKYRERQQQNPKLAELKALLARMKERGEKRRSTTVAEILGLPSLKAVARDLSKARWEKYYQAHPEKLKAKKAREKKGKRR